MFNKSKSHIKAYDAAMCNSAFLCTDWDTYADVPNSGAIKVDGAYEWKEALDALVTDKALRKRLCGELHTWAIEEWNIDKHAQKWVNFYEKTITEGPITSFEDVVRSGSVAR